MTEPATEKQLETMRKLGIPISMNLTKQEGIRIIGNKIDELNADKPKTPEKKAQNGSGKEFHLSPEQVRTNAVDLAIRMQPNGDVMELAFKLEEYLWNGR
jgi:hypothetical protein